ncbi:hypothetical protein PoB_006329600 [Plakobranchus ocellatus]|uniref:Sushi domain-containing protein n=1 Tax=Plakobranchus ocellatus TaxID=259542 RepID=A0AAV4CXZ9_9GAST|nr:hypothetical protein PoB_006329600 [Plakobranchus ocellatus]
MKTEPRFRAVAVVFLVIPIFMPNVLSGNSDTLGWTGVTINNGYRVTNADAWVHLKTSNIRQCLRMCWLFRACAALTFLRASQSCQLYRLSITDATAYSVEADGDGVSVDMRQASMDVQMKKLYGCDERPCSEAELCAPVRNIISYVCIPLGESSPVRKSTYCTRNPPNVPNSETLRDQVESILYSCMKAYRQAGSTFVSTCDRSTGTWSNVDVTCSDVDCGITPSVVGAVVIGMRMI